ncbi:MAG: c-type cytochrome [Chloroflexi bacterium]|nr:c-type cytochrome [Chloroflexota bacterium]
MLRAVSAFVATLQHEETAYDRFLAGDTNALSAEAQLGLELFNGEAGCAACHSGPALTDGQFHSTGVPTNEEIFADPLRHITFRRFFRNLGVADFANLREDIGLAALTKEDADIGQFRTPSLLGVADTAPYMHNGMIATLEDVIQFYNAGGGANAEAVLQPLGLTDAEAAALVAFLRSLSAMPAPLGSPTLPAYDVRPLGDN